MIDIDRLVVICLTIVTLGAIIGISVYQINDRVLMSKNIQEAVAKGIDPISVRCSYTKETDPICITFAATKNEIVLQSVTPKK